MKNPISLILQSLFYTTVLSGCVQSSSKLDERTKNKMRDSIYAAFQKQGDAYLDSLLTDTTGVHTSPIKVTKARIVSREYTNYKDIELTFVNTSNVAVTEIKFRWYGLNVFGEPADMGSYLHEGYGGGFTDEKLLPGRKTSATWSIMSKDAKKVKVAWPLEVVLADETKWKLDEHQPK